MSAGRAASMCDTSPPTARAAAIERAASPSNVGTAGGWRTIRSARRTCACNASWSARPGHPKKLTSSCARRTTSCVHGATWHSMTTSLAHLRCRRCRRTRRARVCGSRQEALPDEAFRAAGLVVALGTSDHVSRPLLRSLTLQRRAYHYHLSAAVIAPTLKLKTLYRPHKG